MGVRSYRREAVVHDVGLVVQIHESENQATAASRRSGAGICVPGVLTGLRPCLFGVFM